MRGADQREAAAGQFLDKRELKYCDRSSSQLSSPGSRGHHVLAARISPALGNPRL